MTAVEQAIESLPAVRVWRYQQARAAHWRQRVAESPHNPTSRRYFAEEAAREAVAQRKAALALATTPGPWSPHLVAGVPSDEDEWVANWLERGRRHIARIEAIARQPLSAKGRAEVMEDTRNGYY